MTDTTRLQLRKYETKKKMREMVENNSIASYMLYQELKAFGKGFLIGLLLTILVVLVAFYLIIKG